MYDRYIDDIPVVKGELFVGFVLSECAHATFTVDTSAINSMEVIAKTFLSYFLIDEMK